MIKAVVKGPLGNCTGIILGIAEENWALLRTGRPILVQLREVHPDLPDISVSLFGAPSEAELFEDFRALAPVRPNPHDTEAEDGRG